MAPLLTFYGDDFTGSTAVMEVLSFAGLPTMLFMEAPTPETLVQYPDLKAVGVAGIARTKDPAWMRENLPAVFQALYALNAPVAHYKVCSTFDSSPQVGSIGVATEIGLSIFQNDWVPLVVGAPDIGRYQVFGTLFAKAGEGIYRLDRHPVMARHPVTPMDEADLGKHLSKQTDLSTGVLDMTLMHQDHSAAAIAACVQAGQKIIALDAFDTASLAQAGRLIWDDCTRPTFAVGSQGIEYALVAHWRSIGEAPQDYQPPVLHPVGQIFGVSGSCAQTTADQISYAKAQGFDVVLFDASTAVDTRTLAQEQERIRDTCLARLSEGKDVIVTTNRGPNDPAIAKMNSAVEAAGLQFGTANDQLGCALGQLVADIREKTGVQRVVIGGGDTSGHALSQLDATALSAIAPLAAGAPMCRVHSQRPKIDGLEVTLKGGQMGTPDFFIKAKSGGV